jgi:putative phosphoesterase
LKSPESEKGSSITDDWEGYMKYAIISDIHGNINAFKAILEATKKEDINAFIFTGDYYADFPFPNEVVNTMKDIQSKYIIRGNKEEYLIDLHNRNHDDWVHDQFNALYWNYNELSKENLEYLMKLPPRMDICDSKKLILTHNVTNLIKDTKLDLLTSSNLVNKVEEEFFEIQEYTNYINDLLASDEKLKVILDSIEADVIVFGHTHVQWHVEINGKLLINAGSCGLPLDYRNTAAYTIMDIKDNRISVMERRVDYDIDQLITSVKSSELYNEAKGWCDIILNEIYTAKDNVTFFFDHACEIAKNVKNETWPLDNKIWKEAIKSWF